MLRLIKNSPVSFIHLALIVTLVYFCIIRFSFVSLFLLGSCLLLSTRRYQFTHLLRVLPLVVVFASFFAYHKWQSIRRDHEQPAAVHQLRLQPDSIRVNGDSLSFRATSDGYRYQVFYTLKSEEEKEYFSNLSVPLLLSVEATVSEAETQRNFQGFDYQSYLETQEIYSLVNIEVIQSSQQVHSWNPLDWLSSWRRAAVVHIRHCFPSPMRQYMTGLLFGELDSEFDQMGDIYSSLGIIHLFALSGMQVGFFVTIWRILLLRLGLKRETVDKLQVPFSVLYAGLTGFSISVIRALIQKIVGNLGITGLDNIAVTLGICLLLSPNLFLTTGGVLSFVYAFLLTILRVENLSVFWKKVSESLLLAVGVLPVLLLYFSSFQPLSILLTALFSFLFDGIFLPLLSVVFLLSFCYPLTQVNGLFIGLERLITWLSTVIGRPIVFGKPSLVIGLFLLLLLALLYDYYRQKGLALALAGLLVSCLFFVKNPMENEITMVDIGQGDSIFLRDMSGRSILIDVGGKVSFETEDWKQRETDANASRTLVPYLYSRGVDKIDTLVLTHTDADHIGDIREVAKAIEIGQIFVSQGSLTNPGFVATLKQLNLPVHVVKVGEQLPIFDGHLEVLYPSRIGDGGNNDSIVLYGELLHTHFLFTGDLEEGELDLVNSYPDLKVDVLKAGHHGSKGSSLPAFLSQIRPNIVLISAGKNNRYQHPHPETLERFADIGSTVYRTDQDGAIRFKGWNSWSVETVK